MENDYVLVTPARNEEAYIEKTLQSVITQTLIPKKWVIVSDGSSDRTDEIVSKYAADYGFIQLLRADNDAKRNFSSKVKAIMAGINEIKDLKYQFIGNLDADVSFNPHYFECIIEKFNGNKKLGIAGGLVIDVVKDKLIRRVINTSWSVSGAVQLFRRKCHEEIGGYFPLERGGEDAIAEVMARKYGWKVKTFTELKVLHHRRTGTAQINLLSWKFTQGIGDYSLGYHPLFEISKFLFRIKEKPYLLASFFRMCGFFWASLKRKRRQLPDEVVTCVREEQLARLSSILSKLYH